VNRSFKNYSDFNFWFSTAPLVFFIFILSCDKNKNPESTHGVLSATSDVLSIDELFVDKEKYLNKEISVSGYLFTHEEGPWLASKPGSPIKNILRLIVSEDFQINNPEGRQIRWFQYDSKGKAVKISGFFSIEIEKLPLDGHFRKKPQIRVSGVKFQADPDTLNSERHK
jgi:hypothetical protein